jgi:hypothetical protein
VAVLASPPQIMPKQAAAQRLMRYHALGLDATATLALLRHWNATADPPLDDHELVSLVHSIPAPQRGVGKESNFHPISAATLLATPAEPVLWVWQPFLPEAALTLLAAQPKAGKSTLAYALAVAVSQGQPFLDYPTTRGGVLIWALEEHLRDVKLRLQRFRGRLDDWIHVHAGPLDNSPATFTAVSAFIGNHGVKLVIVDTLARWWRVKDENNNAELGAAVAPLLELARGTGATVLLVHHERKTGGQEGRGIRGGSALLALVDQALQLERRQGGDPSHRTLTSVGRYAETPREIVRALRLGLVTVNPVKGIPKLKEAGGRVVYLPPATNDRLAHEENALREALPANLRAAFTVSVHTGLRWSEQAALLWRDIDMLAGTIDVVKEW